MIRSLINSLVLTLIIENGVAVIIGVRRSKDFMLITLTNIVTNPILVHTLNVLSFIFNRAVHWYVILPLEVAVVVTEGLLYKNRLICKNINPFLFSLMLNATSYFGGRVIYEIITTVC
jgi:hypothetical protein